MAADAPDLTTPAVRAFLREGTRTGKLAYTASDGRPLVVPVWFVVEEERIAFETSGTAAKTRALRRDARTCLCVDLEAPPYAFVHVQAVATVVEDPSEVERVALAVAQRYVGAERAAEFARRNAGPGQVAVHLAPAKVLANFDVTG